MIHDVRIAARTLAKQRGFVIVALLTLALGIGGSTAIFSVIDGALLRPLPYPEPDRLVEILIEGRRPDGQLSAYAPSIEDIRDWSTPGGVISHVAMWRNVFGPVMLDGPQLEQIRMVEITEGYLGVFGVTPLIGRGFGPEDVREGAPAVVLVGYSFWQTRFGSNPNIVGQSVRLDGQAASIIGLLPANFRDDVPLWRPLRASVAAMARRGQGGRVNGRLKPGIEIEQARQRLDDQMRRLDAGRGRAATGPVRLASLHEYTVRGYRQTVAIITAAMVFVLLIACINVACLLLARGAGRTSEVGVRLAIGASRAAVIRQLLTESVLLSLLGGTAGVLLAWVSLNALVATLPLALPADAVVALNGRVLLLSAALSVLTGVLFGLFPALELSRVSVIAAIGRGDKRHGAALSRRGGQALVAVEVALALVLLTGAGLMIRSFDRILAVDVGFDPETIVVLEAAPVDRDPQVIRRFFPALVDSIRSLPGVDAAGGVDNIALGRSNTSAVMWVDEQWTSAGLRQVEGDYFGAMGMTVVAGRLPLDAETWTGVPVAVINQSAARDLFGNMGPLGQRLRVQGVTFDVVGVVQDMRHWGPLSPADPEVFVPLGHLGVRSLRVAVRSRLPLAELAPQLERATHSIGPRALLVSIRRGDDMFSETITTPRKRLALLGLLGALGVLLCCVGILGTTAGAVARRTREIGVRVACGASTRDVVRTMVRDVAVAIGCGLGAGAMGAVMATPAISSFLFEVPANDVVTFLAVAVAIGLSSLVAAWLPARRAARVDPVIALRVD